MYNVYNDVERYELWKWEHFLKTIAAISKIWLHNKYNTHFHKFQIQGTDDHIIPLLTFFINHWQA